eukprot:NODE_9_length_47730_cov_0.323718.p23 type:complete len:195 gc:universal NODE_9_length_47730_cov_0.323718:43723-44307(+)
MSQMSKSALKFIFPFFGDNRFSDTESNGVPDGNNDEIQLTELELLKMENKKLGTEIATLNSEKKRLMLDMECIEMENRVLRGLKKQINQPESKTILSTRYDSFIDDKALESETGKLKRLLKSSNEEVVALKNANCNLVLQHEKELNTFMRLRSKEKDLALRLRLEIIQNRSFIEQYRLDSRASKSDFQEAILYQ